MRTAKICKRCGAIIEDAAPQCEYCVPCRLLNRREQQKAYKKRKAEAVKVATMEKRAAAAKATAKEKIPPKPAVKSIEQVVREARAAKMSYGQYVAKMRR